MVVTVSVSSAAAGAEASGTWSGALSWYLSWNTKSPVGPDQTCSGRILGSSIVEFNCQGELIIIEVVPAEDRRCSVLFIRGSYRDEVYKSGTRVQTSPLELRCGGPEVPIQLSAIQVTKSTDGWSRQLSEAAMQSAEAYFNRMSTNGCTLHFPKVNPDDPFAHVYRECQGKVDSIWEFPIKAGRVATYSHWTYTAARGNLPAFSEERLRDRSYWFHTAVEQDKSNSGQRKR